MYLDANGGLERYGLNGALKVPNNIEPKYYDPYYEDS